MTIRTQAAITFGPGDLTRTDSGVTWGVKCTESNGLQFIYAFVKASDGTWGLDGTPECQLEEDFGDAMKTYASVQDWYTKSFLPKLNAWLKVRFPANVAPTVKTPFEQADALVNSTRIALVNGQLTALP